MTFSAARLLWLLAATLATLVAVEAIPPHTPGILLAPRGAASPPRTITSVPEPVATWVAAALARPLFAIDRRPPALVAATEAAAGPQNLPRLAGIVVSPRGRSAIFAGGDDKSMVVAEGAAVGRWRVVAIHADAVDVTGPQGTRTVKPAYSNQPAPTVAAALPPVPQNAALAGFLASSQSNNAGNPILTQQPTFNPASPLFGNRR